MSGGPLSIPVSIRQAAVSDPLVAELLETVEAAHAENGRYKVTIRSLQEWGESLPKPQQNELFALIGRPS